MRYESGSTREFRLVSLERHSRFWTLARLKVSLRRQQIEAAKKRNPTMLIWLGKQLLEQRDKIEVKIDATVTTTETVKLSAICRHKGRVYCLEVFLI
jgi:DNA-binding response OmpR family regulator